MSEHNLFQMELARLNVARYEECDLLFDKIRAEQQEFAQHAKEHPDDVMYAKYTDEPLSAALAFQRGMEAAMNIIDGRMTELAEW